MNKSFLIVGVASSLLATTGVASANEKRMIFGSDKDVQELKAAKKKGGEQVWIVSLATDTERSYSVCTSSKGFKFIVGDLVVIASGPDQVAVMNKRSKQYWQVPTKDFNGLKYVERFDVEKLEAVQPKKGEKTEDLSGQHVLVYGGTATYGPDRAAKMGGTNAKVSVSAADKIPSDPAAKPILEKLYGIKTLNGIPLEINLETEKGDKIQCLSTNWCLKQNLEAGFFAVPKHFVRVKTQAEIENPKALPAYKPHGETVRRKKGK